MCRPGARRPDLPPGSALHDRSAGTSEPPPGRALGGKESVSRPATLPAARGRIRLGEGPVETPRVHPPLGVHPLPARPATRKAPSPEPPLRKTREKTRSRPMVPEEGCPSEKEGGHPIFLPVSGMVSFLRPSLFSNAYAPQAESPQEHLERTPQPADALRGCAWLKRST